MRRVIFIHVPRTAGMSIRKYATRHRNHFIIKGWNHIPIESKADFITTGHASIESLIEQGFLEREVYNDSFKFAFVRNPWDRLVSTWGYYKSFRGEVDKSTRFLRSFELFVEEVIVKKNWIPSLEYKIMRPYFQHALPQMSWLGSGVDFIGRFERLNEDWQTICEMGNLKYQLLKKTHTIKRFKHYREHYTDEMAKQVAEFYTEEITRFGYRF